MDRLNASEPSRTQFPIHRLFWMTIVASFFLAISNRLGMQNFLSSFADWFSTGGLGLRSAMIVGVVVFLSISLAYFLWFSFGLPQVFESLSALRRRRKELRKSLEQEILGTQTDQARTESPI